MSSIVSFPDSVSAGFPGEVIVMSVVLLWCDSVCPRDELQRVQRHPSGLLGDGGVGEMAVPRDDVAGSAGDLVTQRLRDGHGDGGVLRAKAPQPVDAAALLHDGDLGA